MPEILDVSKPPQSAVSALLIEDDDHLRTLMARSLKARGFEVVESGSLHPALSLIASGFAPHVCVLDLHLPNGQGLDVVRALLAIGGRWPIVIVTGEYDDRWAEEAYYLSSRVQQYILKSRLVWTDGSGGARSGTDGVTLAKFCKDAMARNRTNQLERQQVAAEAIKNATPSTPGQIVAKNLGLARVSPRSLRWIVGAFGAGLVGVGASVQRLAEWPNSVSPALVGATIVAFAAAVVIYAAKTRR